MKLIVVLALALCLLLAVCDFTEASSSADPEASSGATGAAGTGDTGAAGTGDTGAAGTGDTGATGGDTGDTGATGGDTGDTGATGGESSDPGPEPTDCQLQMTQDACLAYDFSLGGGCFWSATAAAEGGAWSSGCQRCLDGATSDYKQRNALQGSVCTNTATSGYWTVQSGSVVAQPECQISDAEPSEPPSGWSCTATDGSDGSVRLTSRLDGLAASSIGDAQDLAFRKSVASVLTGVDYHSVAIVSKTDVVSSEARRLLAVASVDVKYQVSDLTSAEIDTAITEAETATSDGSLTTALQSNDATYDAVTGTSNQGTAESAEPTASDYFSAASGTVPSWTVAVIAFVALAAHL